MINKHNYHNY